MKAPFTSEQFFEVFKNYNLTIFPLQGILLLTALFAIYLAAFPVPNAGRIISAILALLWLWMGLAYHIAFFSTINKAAYLFGAGFIVQAILFLSYGVFREKLKFQLLADRYGYAAAIAVAYALVIYPIYGYFLGHRFPYAPGFGLPCPTTIFTFGLLLATERCPIGILIIPVIWSLIGFTAAFSFGIFEDTGLIIAALYTLFTFIQRRGKRLKPGASANPVSS